MLCRNTIFIMALAATSCNAFWWGSETREIEPPQPQPVVKPIPVGYFRTFTYQPVTFNPQPSPYYSYQPSQGLGLPTTKMLQPNQFYGWQHPKQYAPINQPMSLSSTIYGTLPFQAQQSQQSTQTLHPSATTVSALSSPSPFNINNPSSISSNGNNIGLSSSQLSSIQNSPSQQSSGSSGSSSSLSSSASSSGSQSNGNNINSVSIEPQQIQQLPSQQLSHQIPIQPSNQFLSDNHLPSTAPAQFNQQLLQQQSMPALSQQLPQPQPLTQLPQQQLQSQQQQQQQQQQQPQPIGSASMFGNNGALRQMQFPSNDPTALPSSSYYSNVAPQMPSSPSQTVSMPQVQFVPCMCPITVGLPPEVLANKRNDELLLTIPAEFTTSREAIHESQSQVLEQLQQHQQKTQQQQQQQQQEPQPLQQTEEQQQ